MLKKKILGSCIHFIGGVVACFSIGCVFGGPSQVLRLLSEIVLLACIIALTFLLSHVSTKILNNYIK